MSLKDMKGRWPRPDEEIAPEDLMIALDNASLALPGWSYGKLIQAATIIQAGYWPQTLKQVTDAELLKGLIALVPIEGEEDWVVPDEENEEENA